MSEHPELTWWRRLKSRKHHFVPVRWSLEENAVHASLGTMPVHRRMFQCDGSCCIQNKEVVRETTEFVYENQYGRVLFPRLITLFPRRAFVEREHWIKLRQRKKRYARRNHNCRLTLT